ncbi:hypothetical protein HZS_1625, partial [Henneguya salminicola]
MADLNFYQVHSKSVPFSYGPFSHSLMVGGVLFISGQLGQDNRTRCLIGKDIESQTRKAMENIEEFLTSASLDWSCIAKTTVYLKRIDDFHDFNECYAKFLKEPYPTRTVI